MISICHVQVLPLLSGVQRSMLDMLDRLDRGRYQLHVACQGPGPLTAELARRDIACHYIPALDRPIHPLRDALAYYQLRRLFLRYRFNLVHTHSSKPGVLARIAARRAGVPRVVHHVHGFAFHDFSPWRQRWIYGRLERLAGAYCDRVVFVNHALRELAVRRGLLPPEKCETIHVGVDLRKFSPALRVRRRAEARAAFGLSFDQPVVLVSGRLERQKQSLILPEIVARLDALGPHASWQLLVVGSGALEGELATRVEQLGFTRRVRMVGWQSEPELAYAAADVVLLPSLWEGLSATLLQAQASGLPAVASDIAANREVVAPETGRLCPPCDAGAFAQALKELIDKPHLGAAMGVAGRQRAEAHFDNSVCLSRLTEMYDQLLNAATTTARRAA
jgi:glycosyltransferase involved in cell wall biosynthesis